MKFKIFIRVFILLLVVCTSTQFITRTKKYVFDEKVFDCSEKDKKKVFNIDLDVIAESEYEMYLNGTMTFLIDIESPWRVEAYGKKLEQGEWYKKVERSVRDFCFSKNNPADIFYPLFGKFKNCPISKGVSLQKSNSFFQ